MMRCLIVLGLAALCLHAGRCQSADAIEFAQLNDATACGWDVTDHTTLAVTRDAKVGQFALEARPQAGAKPYRGINLFHDLDLTGAGPADAVSFWVKQNYGSGIRIQLWTAKGPFNRSFNVTPNEWTHLVADLDPAEWENPQQQAWGKIVRISIYEITFQNPEHFMILDGFSITAGGKPMPMEDPAHRMQQWTFPHQTDAVWVLGSAEAAWAISKATGQVAGGWNVKTKERYLNFVETRYYLDDRKSQTIGRGSDDRILQAKFDAKTQRVELTCSNPTVPDLKITKRVWLDGHKLFQRIGVTTRSSDLQFVTVNMQTGFTPAYRNGGYYMGGADGGGPLVPAPQISEWQKVTQYQNSTKGMVLHQPEKGFSFAHMRTKLDEQFVWPYHTGAIASYVEPPNMMSYTPDGWDMSLGTSKLSNQRETSYEQFLSIFAGDWQQFLRKEFPSLPEVRQALKQIPPAPGWVNDIKIECGEDTSRLKQMLAATDEGAIMVLVNLSGSWADYHVDEGMQEGYGGWATGPELRDHVARLKALSPRVKVGLYMWQLSTYATTRIYRAHPEWFRTNNKDGEMLSTFPGMAPNFAQLLSIPACYQELLSQFDTVLSYLGTDYIYLDDPKAINLIDWKSGEYTRDDLSFRFFLDLKKLVARHGPDKMVFFNNRGNPYGDVNFVEARDQLRANYWRAFVGIGAVIQEFVSATRPEARTCLLYYTPPLRREYMNRVLALGWLPSWEYCGVVASRPFFQAAYEVGNCTPIPASYTPDWKQDKDTNLESYAVRRQGDTGVLLSFINHAETQQSVPIHLDLQSLKLPPGRVSIWEYEVEDGMEYEGQATESLARKVYRGTGWQLDRATKRRLLWSGPLQPALDLKLDMKPLILHQLYVTTEPAGVYSENGLPNDYLFNQKPEMKLDAKTDWAQGTLRVQIRSARDEAEAIAFLPLSQFRVRQASLDGRPLDPTWVWEGGDALPVWPVAKGQHTLTVSFTAEAPTPAVVAGFAATSSAVTVPGCERALLTVERDGRQLFGRMVTGKAGVFGLPLSPFRPTDGSYSVSVRAVADAGGRLQPVSGATGVVQLPAAKIDLGVGPEHEPRGPEEHTTTAVDRTIKGVEVLSAATLTAGETPNDIQPGLKLNTASALPDELTLKAGTSRALLQGQPGLMGPAFAGFEIKNLRRVQVRLANTFYNAFHYRGPGIHIPDQPHTRHFAGIIVDYHTPAGYTKRVALATGVLNRECSSPFPDWGRNALHDESRDLGAKLIETPEATFALDLQRYAPPDWDGQIWLNVGTDWICANRRLELQILAVNEAVTGPFIEGVDPRAFREAYEKPRTLTVPRSPGGIIIDGVISEESWREAARTEEFFLIGGEGVSRAKTSVMVMYDDTNVYVAFTCDEPDRQKPLIIGGAPWDDDEVEVYFDPDRDQKTYRQIILNAANTKMEWGEAGPTPVGATTAVHVAPDGSWSVEMCLPHAGLGATPPKPGDTWRASFCRLRPPSAKTPVQELIVWAPLQGGFNDLPHFGTITFK